MPRPFPLIQTVPVPTGTSEYEAQRALMLKEFADAVPESLYIAQSYVDKPPKDVTGIPRECGLLSEAELAITDKYDAVGLAEAIRSKALSSEAVVSAFAKRAIIAHQVSGCLTDWFMDEAVARARELDAHLAKTGEVIGPLHGVPFSIKEHMPIAGRHSTAGYLATRTRDDKDAHVVAILRQLGAVFYCKTAQPQSIMHLESPHPLGRVLNPHNIHLSAGGSTGGEAALIALRGSVLGLGTDIGGSIRCPAGFCGIYGFKPTTLITPSHGLINGGSYAELNIPIAAGPMAGSLRDLDLFMRAVLGTQPHLLDPKLTPLAWTGLQTPVSTPLKVGFLMDDGHIRPQPPVTRALLWAQTQLKAAATGAFEIKPFAPFKAEEAIQRIRKEYWPEGGTAIRGLLAKGCEPAFPLTDWILQDAEPDGVLTAVQLHAVRMSRLQFQIDFARHWTAQDVDIVICPVFVGPACAHETSFYWNYTAFWNYVDYPGVVVPTPHAARAKGVEPYPAGDDTPLSKEDEHVRQLWADGDFEGAPIDLQIVARRNYDNQLFGALQALQEALLL